MVQVRINQSFLVCVRPSLFLLVFHGSLLYNHFYYKISSIHTYTFFLMELATFGHFQPSDSSFPTNSLCSVQRQTSKTGGSAPRVICGFDFFGLRERSDEPAERIEPPKLSHEPELSLNRDVIPLAFDGKLQASLPEVHTFALTIEFTIVYRRSALVLLRKLIQLI